MDPSASEKRQIIERIAERYRFVAYFPKYSLDRPSFDLRATIEDLKSANFIIADLTQERPSCYYELGLAEALQKPVYLIAQSATDIHQTAARGNVSFFEDLPQYEAVVDSILSKEAKNIRKG